MELLQVQANSKSWKIIIIVIIKQSFRAHQSVLEENGTDHFPSSILQHFPARWMTFLLSAVFCTFVVNYPIRFLAPVRETKGKPDVSQTGE